MSIEKLDFQYVKQAQKSYTTFLNDVVQNINNGFYLGVYCYLSSLPPNWVVNKAHLAKHFCAGRDKIAQCLAWLCSNKLIEYQQDRNIDGTLSTCAIVVKDGKDFIEYIKNQQLIATESTATLKSRSPDYPVTGKSGTINTIQKKKRKKEIKSKEEQRYLSAPKGGARAHFDKFYEMYPRKRNKARALKIWEAKNCDAIAETILSDVQNRILNDADWKNPQFILHPSTYLQGERWHDELTLAVVAPKKEAHFDMVKRVFAKMQGDKRWQN